MTLEPFLSIGIAMLTATPKAQARKISPTSGMVNPNMAILRYRFKFDRPLH
jgi:hypothetical protein